ncbi:VOC family protein [uncultured Rhodoferax sp.]|mgnify:CR=1 FL=1|uniref:VOC family protein n=1 Tax=uncultured Rhodoferax sp. TaxID=223188 RepID=UPI0025E78719|nr:VOC family protein [uncultured Rhodoferax sp.]
MKFASVRLVTADAARIDTLVSFYTRLTGLTATRPVPDFAELRFAGLVLAITSERMVQQFNAGASRAAANQSAILEFEVDNVDALHQRLADAAATAMPPTTMPWGNRSLLLRDPDGNVVNVFSRPVANAQEAAHA